MLTDRTLIHDAILSAAAQMCVAARTAPKACGSDSIRCAVVSGEALLTLAKRMEEIEDRRGMDKKIFRRDAASVASSTAVVLIGSRRQRRGLNPCSLCGFENCSAAGTAGGHCAFDDIDLGIAIGSAVAMAADLRIDNRILYTAGYAAMELNLLGTEVSTVIAIPLSASPRNIYFYR